LNNCLPTLRNDKLKHWILERLFRLPTSTWEFNDHPKGCNTDLHCSHFNSCSKFRASDKRHGRYLNPCIHLLQGEIGIKEVSFDPVRLNNNKWKVFDSKTKAKGRKHANVDRSGPRGKLPNPDIVHKVSEDHCDVYEVGSGTEICHTNLLHVFNGECPFNHFAEYIDMEKQDKYAAAKLKNGNVNGFKLTSEKVSLYNIIITAIGKPSWRTSETLRKLIKIYNRKEGRKDVNLHQIWISLGRECVNASFINFSRMEKEMRKKREKIDDSSTGVISKGHSPEDFSTSSVVS